MISNAKRRGAVVLAAAALLAGLPGRAAADELELDWSGRIQSDLRFRPEPVGVGEWYGRQELPAGVERNWNTLSLKLDATYGRFKGVAAFDFVYSGFPERMTSVGDLSRIEKADPYRLEARALYVDAKGIFFKDLDLRIGQQIVNWGVGDQFNPTNNLNPDDLRDPLLFGRQAANFMVKADYWLSEDWSISGVLAPIFKPALLPLSGGLALASLDRLPFIDPALRQRIASEQAAARELFGHPTVIGSVTPNLPGPAFDDMQVAYRIAGTIKEQDIALSYYNGRTDFPQPRSNHTRQTLGKRCNPANANDCIEGLLVTDVTLEYPRMHVYGLNATGEVNPFSWFNEDTELSGIGYRFEGALVVPQRQSIKLTNDALALGIPQAAGEYDYDGDGRPGGREPLVVDSTPFLKWVLGLDYTFGEHVYVNAQWVHGLPDEYGAGDWLTEGYAVRQSGMGETANLLVCALSKDGETCEREILRPRLGDYLVIGADFKFMNQAALFRLFTILDVTPLVEESYDDEKGERVRRNISPFSAEGFSMVIFPELDYNFGNGLELSAGALFELGKPWTKFGDPATGGSVVWTRGRYSF
ncbi:DUF1302 family protein [Polyangium aurulentum]|uniref:DUF1302 family protein n=1 Tax=Polyangium aurulentum TaxID=2567896 RepID=UPI0010AE677A|nr:DUF1302 family protein [Polyangium aurulentum]UQA54706.1 hypothetical protein E8A73_025375 [Polyangium aurulentum]